MSSEYKAGYDAGYNFTMSNFQNLRYTNPWPKGWGNGARGNGWAEGCNYARSVIIDKQYPGWENIERLKNGSYKVVFKDGKIIFV